MLCYVSYNRAIDAAEALNFQPRLHESSRSVEWISCDMGAKLTIQSVRLSPSHLDHPSSKKRHLQTQHHQERALQTLNLQSRDPIPLSPKYSPKQGLRDGRIISFGPCRHIYICTYLFILIYPYIYIHPCLIDA